MGKKDGKRSDKERKVKQRNSVCKWVQFINISLYVKYWQMLLGWTLCKRAHAQSDSITGTSLRKVWLWKNEQAESGEALKHQIKSHVN